MPNDTCISPERPERQQGYKQVDGHAYDIQLGPYVQNPGSMQKNI